MSITSHIIDGSNVHVILNTNFNQIDYTKMEVLQDQSVVCDQVQIRYSKPKNVINEVVSNSGSRNLMILITQIDNIQIHHGYFIDLHTIHKTTNETTTIICPIKNQNIFANITKKVT